MLIVLTSEATIENEASVINTLFDRGLGTLHLRKPSFTIKEYRELLKKIHPTFYKRIMLHEHHELCEAFNLKGVHIQEQPRLDLGEKLNTYVSLYKQKGYTVSSSFHEKEAITSCQVRFDYVLLSPVFGSLSKSGYEARGFDVSDLNDFVVGMGGINEETLQKTFNLGYKGVGVLGGIWNTENPAVSFDKIYQKMLEVC